MSLGSSLWGQPLVFRRCGANVAFADGRADLHKWRYLGRTRTYLQTPVKNQADHADLIWILSHVPDVNGR